MIKKILFYSFLLIYCFFINLMASTIEKNLYKINIDKNFANKTDWDSFAFSGRNAISIADDGSVFVVEQKENKIYKFDKNGQFLFSFGRKGQGPGEFQSIGNINSRGKLICVEDYATLKKIHIFNVEGKLLKEIRTNNPNSKAEFVNENTLAICNYKSIYNKESQPKDFGINFSRDSSILINLYDIKKDKNRYVCSKIETTYAYRLKNGSQFSLGYFISKKVIVKTLNNSIAVGKTNSDIISIYSATGHKKYEIKLHKKPYKISNKMKRDIYDTNFKSDEKLFKRIGIKTNPNNIIPFKTFPLYSDILENSDGNILIIDFKYDYKSKENQIDFQIYSPKGKYLGESSFNNERFDQLWGYDIIWELKHNSLYILLENIDNPNEPYYEVVKFNIR